MIFKKNELKHLWPFYTYTLIYSITAMIIPFMIIYFVNLGLSFTQIAIITTGYAVGMFLFEIPTGAFADSYSRKYSVIIGFITVAIPVSLMGYLHSFFAIFILWVLTGIGMTFVSGAEEAWVIDNLNKAKQKSLQQEYFIKIRSIISLGIVISPLLGAYIVKNYSMDILWPIFGSGFIINAIIIWIFAKESYKPKKTTIKKAMKETFSNSKKGLQFIIKKKSLLFLTLAGVFVGLMTISRDGWQPFMVSLGLQEFQLGYLYSIIAAFLVITPFLSRFLTKTEPKKVGIIITLIRMIILFCVIFLYPPMFFIGGVILLLEGSIITMGDPVISAYMHKLIPKKIRASVISAISMYRTLIFGVASLIVGFTMDIFGPQKIIAATALFGLIAICFYKKI